MNGAFIGVHLGEIHMVDIGMGIYSDIHIGYSAGGITLAVLLW